ncbi:hypothetical protein [Kitasatospora sp. P5_F3]
MTARTDVDESLRRVRLAAKQNATATRQQQEKLAVLREWDRAMLTAAHPALTGPSPVRMGWSG